MHLTYVRTKKALFKSFLVLINYIMLTRVYSLKTENPPNAFRKLSLILNSNSFILYLHIIVDGAALFL